MTSLACNTKQNETNLCDYVCVCVPYVITRRHIPVSYIVYSTNKIINKWNDSDSSWFAPNLMHAEIFHINISKVCVLFTCELLLKIFWFLMPNLQCDRNTCPTYLSYPNLAWKITVDTVKGVLNATSVNKIACAL